MKSKSKKTLINNGKTVFIGMEHEYNWRRGDSERDNAIRISHLEIQ
jgi:hypothetical protein